MREAMAIEAKLRSGKPEPKDMAEERALRASLCPYWCDGAPAMHATTDVSIPGEAGPVRARVYRPTAQDGAPMMLLMFGVSLSSGGRESWVSASTRSVPSWRCLPPVRAPR